MWYQRTISERAYDVIWTRRLTQPLNVAIKRLLHKFFLTLIILIAFSTHYEVNELETYCGALKVILTSYTGIKMQWCRSSSSILTYLICSYLLTFCCHQLQKDSHVIQKCLWYLSTFLELNFQRILISVWLKLRARYI